MNLQTGAFGDPEQTDTLILFWTKMEELHYPGAGSTRKFLEERREREQEALAAQQTAQQARTIPAGLTQAIDRQAQQDAAQAAMSGQRPIG